MREKQRTGTRADSSTALSLVAPVWEGTKDPAVLCRQCCAGKGLVVMVSGCFSLFVAMTSQSSKDVLFLC